jgi:hypothetical protein
MYHILQNKIVTALTHEKQSSPQECAHFSTRGNVAFSPLEKSYFSSHRGLLGIVLKGSIFLVLNQNFPGWNLVI